MVMDQGESWVSKNVDQRHLWGDNLVNQVDSRAIIG